MHIYLAALKPLRVSINADSLSDKCSNLSATDDSTKISNKAHFNGTLITLFKSFGITYNTEHKINKRALKKHTYPLHLLNFTSMIDLFLFYFLAHHISGDIFYR